jgi:hypothetical protein
MNAQHSYVVLKPLITARTPQVFTNAHVEKDILETKSDVMVCNTTMLIIIIMQFYYNYVSVV